jgi:hypothetical protein
MLESRMLRMVFSLGYSELRHFQLLTGITFHVVSAICGDGVVTSRSRRGTFRWVVNYTYFARPAEQTVSETQYFRANRLRGAEREERVREHTELVMRNSNEKSAMRRVLSRSAPGIHSEQHQKVH